MLRTVLPPHLGTCKKVMDSTSLSPLWVVAAAGSQEAAGLDDEDDDVKTETCSCNKKDPTERIKTVAKIIT